MFICSSKKSFLRNTYCTTYIYIIVILKRILCSYSREHIILTMCKSHLACSTRLLKKALGMYLYDLCVYMHVVMYVVSEYVCMYVCMCVACMYVCSMYSLCMYVCLINVWEIEIILKFARCLIVSIEPKVGDRVTVDWEGYTIGITLYNNICKTNNYKQPF